MTKDGPHPFDVHVGKRLRMRRSLLGVTQEKLASAVGLTFQQVQKYERGANRISCSRLYEFSQALETTLDYFFQNFDNNTAVATAGLSDTEQASLTPDDIFQKKETINLVRAYYSVKDEEVRKRIMALIKSFADTEGNN
jgi:transcriptional regulator with XRE-family HTH domain